MLKLDLLINGWFQIFLSNIKSSIYQVIQCNTNNFPTAVWFQITNNNNNNNLGGNDWTVLFDP